MRQTRLLKPPSFHDLLIIPRLTASIPTAEPAPFRIVFAEASAKNHRVCAVWTATFGRRFDESAHRKMNGLTDDDGFAGAENGEIAQQPLQVVGHRADDMRAIGWVRHAQCEKGAALRENGVVHLDGRWLTIIAPIPYFRPSLAIRRTAPAAAPL